MVRMKGRVARKRNARETPHQTDGVSEAPRLPYPKVDPFSLSVSFTGACFLVHCRGLMSVACNPGALFPQLGGSSAPWNASAKSLTSHDGETHPTQRDTCGVAFCGGRGEEGEALPSPCRGMGRRTCLPPTTHRAPETWVLCQPVTVDTHARTHARQSGRVAERG